MLSTINNDPLFSLISNQSMVAFQHDSFESSVMILDAADIFFKKIQDCVSNSYHHIVAAAPYAKVRESRL